MKTQMNRYPRILIVGTTPYNPSESSRALDTYFHNWPKENLHMIFSNSNKPIKGHCESLFQITDYDVFQVFLKKQKSAGRIFDYDDLENESAPLEEQQKLLKYKKKNTFRFYARKALWSKNRWLSEELINWVDEFKPEAIYICFSDDYFILNISYYLAKKYSIPVICQIGDDYYFKKNKNLFIKPYLHSYKKLFKKIMSLGGFGVYISDKLADKYNSHFSLHGYPFYLSSDIKWSQVKSRFEFNYFGKINLGRDQTLAMLGDALNKIDNSFVVNVYSKDVSSKVIKLLLKHHCFFKDTLPYNDVMSIMNSGSFNIIASGFRKKDVEATRYSLSTKVSDSLASSGPLIAIGPNGDGAIDFLKPKNCAILIGNKRIDIDCLREKIFDKKYLSTLIENAHNIFSSMFLVDNNRLRFEENCRKITELAKNE